MGRSRGLQVKCSRSEESEENMGINKYVNEVIGPFIEAGFRKV